MQPNWIYPVGPCLECALIDRRADEQPEWAILEAARSGKLEAFNQLVERYQELAYNVALRTLGHSEDAADATQEAFISAYRALRGFRGEAFKPWLLRIVVNACYDQLRRRKRWPAESLDALTDDGPEPLQISSSEAGPEIAALAAESAASIQGCLDSLSPEHRLIVVLCDVQELSYDEASEVLGVPVGTVRSRLSRARARLRDALAACGELPKRPERHQFEGLGKT